MVLWWWQPSWISYQHKLANFVRDNTANVMVHEWSLAIDGPLNDIDIFHGSEIQDGGHSRT
jgi:hypothetical protein